MPFLWLLRNMPEISGGPQRKRNGFFGLASESAPETMALFVVIRLDLLYH